MRSSRGIVMAVALCTALPVGACAEAGSRPIDASEAARAGWRQLADGPLSPREQALGLWTGREVLVLGGSDAPPCPPNASCALDPTPPTDAAALDPATNTWRPIARPPVPLLGAQGVVLGSAAYLLPYESAGLLVYRIEKDTWERLPAPVSSRQGYQLQAAGEHLVAYPGTDETGPLADQLFDPGTSTWTALPADPLGPAFDRGMAWTGRELMLFDHELIPNPGAEGPTLTRMAALDLGTRKWRRLPDAPSLYTSPWIMAGDKLINPALGGADGGKIGNWGRTYPNGGMVDPVTGAWSPLPGPPGGETLGAGLRTGDTAFYPGLADVVLDARSGAWQRVAGHPAGDLSGATVVAAGTRMLVFGGASGDQLRNATWMWTPSP